MTETTTRTSPFIDNLVRLTEKDDRGGLAALRRGLGRPPGAAPELYPYVVPYLWDANRNRENAMFTVATLFGMFPNHQPGAGTPLKVLRQLDLESESTERRVLALLNADSDSLPTHLRHLISLIRSHGPDRHLDYGLLLRDLTNWESPDRWVQRNWARDWWAGFVPHEETDAAETDVDAEEDN